MRVNIFDEKSIKEVSSYLHDGIFERGSCEYDAAQKKFLMTVKYQKGTEKGEKGFLFYKNVKTIWREGLLIFENVLSCEERIDEVHKEYVIASIDYSRKTNIITIVMAYGGEICIKANALQGLFKDRDI